jgi:amino acid transporter
MLAPQRQSIGLLGATAIGIGGMVGGGIFAVLGVAAERAGGATPVAFALAGAVAGLTAFSYSRLAVRYPSSGGTVTFVDRAFGVGEVTGSLNIVLWAGYIVTAALYASAFGNYSATLVPGDAGPVVLRVLVTVGVLVPWLINIADASLVSRSESIVVGVKMTMLMVVIAAGVPQVSTQRLDPATWASPLSVVAAGMLIFVAYEGFELIANASDDCRRPTSTLPRAFALSVGVVVVLYVVIALVTVGSLSPERIVETADYALAAAAQTSLGQLGFTLVAVSAVLATFSAINATLYGTARLSFTIASEGELPDALERRAWKQPVGLHITAALALALAVSMPVGSISAMASAIFLAVFAVVNVAELTTDPSRGARAVAWAGALGCGVSLVVLVAESVRNDPAAMAILVVLVVAALLGEHAVLKGRRHGRMRLAAADRAGD